MKLTHFGQVFHEVGAACFELCCLRHAMYPERLPFAVWTVPTWHPDADRKPCDKVVVNCAVFGELAHPRVFREVAVGFAPSAVGIGGLAGVVRFPVVATTAERALCVVSHRYQPCLHRSKSLLWEAVQLAGKVGVELEAFEAPEALFRLGERHGKRLVRTCFVLDKPRGFAACRAPFGSAQSPTKRPFRCGYATRNGSPGVALWSFLRGF